jgi:hypothetical protein
MSNVIDSLSASGIVLDVNGRPFPGVVVRIIRPLLRGETILAETKTGRSGRFAINVRRPKDMPVTAKIQLVAINGSAADERGRGLFWFLRWLLELIIRFFRWLLRLGRRGRKVSLTPDEDPDVHEVRSRLMLPEDARDVVLRFGPKADNEYSELLIRLKPLLGGIKIHELVESEQQQDLTFLSRELSIPIEMLMDLVLAERLSRTIELPAALFYAFLRLGVPASLPVPLVEASDAFRLIEPLTTHVGTLIIDVDEDISRQTLKKAIELNIISQTFSESMDTLLERFRALRETHRLNAPFNTGKTPLRSLLNAAGLAENRYSLFLDAWKEHAGSAESFWRSITEEDTGLYTEEVESLRRTFEIGSVVRNHVPLIRIVNQQLESQQHLMVSELARLELEEWTELVLSAGDDAVPPDFDLSGEEEPKAAFAREIHDTVQRRYPTTALAAYVERDQILPGTVQDAVNQFFYNNPGLDLTVLNLGPWLEENRQQVFGGIEQDVQPAVIQQVQRLQRVLRIIRDPRAGAVLLTTNLDSGARIYSLGEQQVVRRLEEHGLTRLEARRVFHKGSARYGTSLALYSRYNYQLRGIYPAATGPGAPFGDVVDSAILRNPSLANLFGSQDVCDVDPCTSILSPSAYLSDLLLWLRDREILLSETTSYTNALVVFAARRPDVLHLKLNCPNTNTPLPYIDLVNELLEDAVSQPTEPEWRQTTWSADELRAAPEHTNDAAYDLLAEAVFPHHLPYDRAFDELSTLLARVDVPLWQLREALVPVGTDPADNQAIAIAAARFGIPGTERDLITIPHHRPLEDVWGTADLDIVADFLQAAQLNYDELLQLLACRWPWGDGPAADITGRDDSCDTTEQVLSNLNEDNLDRIHRFLRVWHRTDWAMWEIDELLLFGDNEGTLDDALRILFVVDRIQEATGLSVERILSFWQEIGTEAHRLPGGESQRSLYARIFEDPLLSPDPALNLEALIAGPSAALSDHLDAVRAALGLTPEEAMILAGATSGELTLETLSAIHRSVVLVRTLRIGLDDAAYLANGDLTQAFNSPEATLAFIRRTKEIQRAGLSISGLRYVLTRTTTSVARTERQLAEILHRIRSVLQQVHDDMQTGEPALAVLERHLATLPWLRSGELLATAIAIVDVSYAGDEADRNAFIAEYFAAFIDVTVAQMLLATPPNWATMSESERDAEIDSRASQIMQALEEWLTREQVSAAVSSAFSLAGSVSEHLLEEVTLPADTRPILTVLCDGELIARESDGTYSNELTVTALPDQFNALRFLDKLALVVRSLRLSREELEGLMDHGSAINGVVLQELPVLDSQTDLDLDAWLMTTRFLLLNRTFTVLADSNESPPPAIASLADLLETVNNGSMVSEADIHVALAGITGWQSEDIAEVATVLGISAEDWLNVESYERLRQILVIASRTGASAARIIVWGGPDPAPTLDHAKEAWQALKSRYSRDEWLKIAPDIMDPLRIRRRDALSWYLIAQGINGHGDEPDTDDVPRFYDTNDLFSYFLIDTEMSPCQVTTRIIQAYAAVQLFVQRVLMNLELDVPADLAADDGWAQWKWMNRYRVWEAARKVFLWPENWLMEPQRPTRSEIFVAFDRDVHQRESTSDSLETAALNYLDGLDEVARLHVTGMCTDPETGDLYVVGRTASDPARFFLRTFANRKWSAWDQIPHDIAGLNPIPAFYAGRLHLFWLNVFIHTEERQRLDRVDPNRARNSVPPERYIELRVCFSSLRDEIWTPPQASAQSFFDKPPRSALRRATSSGDVEALYTLKTNIHRSQLFVDVYRTGVDSDGELADLEEIVAGGAIALFFGGLLGISSDMVMEQIAGALTALDIRLNSARHLGRAIFEGRFDEFQLRNAEIDVRTGTRQLLARAREQYGPRASDLNPFPRPEAGFFWLFGWLPPEPGMRIEAGGLVARWAGSGEASPLPLRFEHSVNLGTLLETVPRPFRVVGPATDVPFHPRSPFVLSEPRRSWFFEQKTKTRYIELMHPAGHIVRIPYTVQMHSMERFDHPFVRTFRNVLASRGFDGFYRPELQRDPHDLLSDPDPFDLPGTYNPNRGLVQWRNDTDVVDFGYEAPYGIYNWELFFHLPLFIAERLGQNQHFDEARRWFHYIFDPTRASLEDSPQRFWITRPLAELTREEIQAQGINRLLELINEEDDAALKQVEDWRQDPFNPYLLADQRPVAYMKRVVMSYLDNLIAWGDSLFATSSREALNEATQLYVLASELLGPRPHLVPPPSRETMSWYELEQELDAFANSFDEFENILPDDAEGRGEGGGPGVVPLPKPPTFYFKIPPNEKLLGYWDTVEDRLFKLRHCLGLGGEPLALPLFDASIDPALLVRARAAGIDIGSVLLDLGAPLPGYRFIEMHRRAVAYADAVQDLGQKLLSALEAKDAEELAMLMLTQRQRIHTETRQILEWQYEESEALFDAIGIGIELAGYQYREAESEPFMSELERASAEMKSGVIASKLLAMVAYLMMGGIAAIPNVLIGVAGVGGSPQSGAETGGTSASNALEKSAKANEKLLDSLEKGADLVKVYAEAEKRAKKNKQEKEEAAYRRQEAEKQQEAAHLRRLIVQQQIDMHERAAEDLDAEREYLQMKFTNEALYDWMAGQLSDIYFSAFRLATGMARRAERCYRFELGLTDSNFISPNRWDNLRRGLLAGENLSNDLRRLESSYLELNVRRKEITRTISLRREFPECLLELLTTGGCNLILPELLFDRDYPGHYQRRITRASITVERPDAAPDDNVVCEVMLIHNSIRLEPDISGGYPRRPLTEEDPRFVDGFAAVQGIVTGNAIDDPGIFVRDITENLADPRYLPFENAGVISEWRIELPPSRNVLDLSTVTDVKLHLHYTALDGGRALREEALQYVEEQVPDSIEIAFDARSEFPEAWNSFITGAGGDQRFVLPLRPGLLPPVARTGTPQITRCEIWLLSDHQDIEFEASLLPPFPANPDTPISDGVVSCHHFEIDPGQSLQEITVRVRERGAGDWESLSPGQLNGMIIALRLNLR